MESRGGTSSGTLASGTNVPAFLTKLWTLVEDPDTDVLICWSHTGTTFHVFDQARFSKEVLPKYFKHNNMASFVRQLNMYGFRKVVHIEQGGLLKPERDDTEFQHPYFIKGQEHLLENIKRKVTNVSSVKQEDTKLCQDDVSKIMNEVKLMKGKQEVMDSKIISMKHENETLWREVASLRQKHAQQQKVVNKLIQFLISMVQSKGVLGLKRKMPLMLNDSSSAHSLPKYSRQFSLESLQGSSAFSPSSQPLTEEDLFSPDTLVKSGPIISDVTDLGLTSPTEEANEGRADSRSPPVPLTEEPASPACSPRVEDLSPAGSAAAAAETPLSPSTFIDSILRESEPIAAQPDGSQTCLSVACLDKNELSEHLESIGCGLDNLQTVLNGPAINFDSSSLFEMFSPSGSDFSFPDLDTSLASIHDLLTQDQKAAEFDENATESGKQLVQYTAQPVPDSTGGDLAVLLEDEAYYDTADKPDPATPLHSNNHQTKAAEDFLSS